MRVVLLTVGICNLVIACTTDVPHTIDISKEPIKVKEVKQEPKKELPPVTHRSQIALASTSGYSTSLILNESYEFKVSTTCYSQTQIIDNRLLHALIECQKPT